MADKLTEAVADHGQSLYRIAWRILGNADEVDDVLQEIVLEAIRVSQREQVVSWVGLLKRLAVCRSLDQLRKRHHVVSLTDLDLAKRGPSPMDNAIGHELDTKLRQSLLELPERQSQVFTLRYFDDCSNQEISRLLGISPSAVATALKKSRIRLRELLSVECKGARNEK